MSRRHIDSDLSRRIGEQLRIARKKVCRRQEAFAEVMGISPQQWNKVELGKNRVTIDVLVTFRAVYGVSIDAIIDAANGIDSAPYAYTEVLDFLAEIRDRATRLAELTTKRDAA